MRLRARVKWLGLCLGMAVMTACTAPGPREGFAATDDLEPFSRAVLSANTQLDRFALRPLAQGYDIVAPELFQYMIRNGVNHLELPAELINYVLQGDGERSLTAFGRLLVNTVAGAGVLDPATEVGLPREPTDFGITLGRYGVGEGTYLVVPLVGPTTVRDMVGFLVDRGFSPTLYIGQFTALDGFGPTSTGLDLIDGRNRNADLIDDVLYGSEDPYVTLRAGYLQRRRAQVAGDDGAGEALPDIFDDEAPAADAPTQ